MPKLISREEALAQIRAERGGEPCLMCGIGARRIGAVHVLHEDDDFLVFLPRYVRRWGQICVMPHAHVRSFGEMTPLSFGAMSALGHRVAMTLERAQRPKRVYLASTGSSAGELVNSSEHMHLHAIPLYMPDDKPSDIFSWRAGVWVGSDEEWAELLAKYRAAWAEPT